MEAKKPLKPIIDYVKEDSPSAAQKVKLTLLERAV